MKIKKVSKISGSEESSKTFLKHQIVAVRFGSDSTDWIFCSEKSLLIGKSCHNCVKIFKRAQSVNSFHSYQSNDLKNFVTRTNPIFAYFPCISGFFGCFIVSLSSFKVLFILLFVRNWSLFATLPSIQHALKLINGRKITGFRCIGWHAIWCNCQTVIWIAIESVAFVVQTIACIIAVRQMCDGIIGQSAAGLHWWCWRTCWRYSHSIWT